MQFKMTKSLCSYAGWGLEGGEQHSQVGGGGGGGDRRGDRVGHFAAEM